MGSLRPHVTRGCVCGAAAAAQLIVEDTAFQPVFEVLVARAARRVRRAHQLVTLESEPHADELPQRLAVRCRGATSAEPATTGAARVSVTSP